MSVNEKAKLAKRASGDVANLSPDLRSTAINSMADELEKGYLLVLEANEEDLKFADKTGIGGAMRNRLALSKVKIDAMARSLRQIASIPDNLGEIIECIKRPNGLSIEKVRVPFGVIGIIYESRPNVTSDAAGLCVKSGNAVILRGGKEALKSNGAIADLLRKGLVKAGVSPECIQFVDDPGREEAQNMLLLKEYIDLLIPRGGPGLIKATKENSTIPVIETGAGNCHTYVDVDADLKSALSIVENAKLGNPSVCNAMETLLIHEGIAAEFLPKIVGDLSAKGVGLKGCRRALEIVPHLPLATEKDWDTEYLDLILAIKIVSGLDEALAHISRHGTLHSEAIITQNDETAAKFIRSVDAAVVYQNASTRFTDGGEFGFGAEMGISTGKLHARGPMGISELTTYKYVVKGSGQVRR